MFFFKISILWGLVTSIKMSEVPHTSTLSTPETATTECTDSIFCVGEIINDVLLSDHFTHPKDFVDLKLKLDRQTVLDNYRKIKEANPKPNKEMIANFVKSNFEEDHLDDCTLSDFKKEPEILNKIENEKYREFVKDVIEIWPSLAGKINEDVKNNRDSHSYIYLPHCFVKAGGFFKDQFYWDTMWIIRGLLLSEMYDTAKGMLLNYFELIKEYGYILNANRIYYKGRSQPPFLILMMKAYKDVAPGGNEFVKENMEYVVKEFKWWQTNRMLNVKKNGKTYEMFRYYQKSVHPRPEGYIFDYNLAKKLTSEADKNNLYTSIHSTAESGWDFSSRDQRRKRRVDHENSRLNLDVENIIMVDLNSIMEFNARQLSEWYSEFSENDKANIYRNIADELLTAIEDVLWHKELGIWTDYIIETETNREDFYASNLVPLYTSSYKKEDRQSYGQKAVEYLKKKGILTENGEPVYYGVPASLKNTMEQWDCPNTWPPSQAMIIEGLFNSGDQEAKKVALRLAKVWIKTNYEGFKKNKKIFEKYNALKIGASGSGGTYEVQTGFGWSNGTIMILFNLFKNELQPTDYDDMPSPPNQCPENLVKDPSTQNTGTLDNK